MARDDFAERVAGVASLAEPVRRDLYLYVVAQPEPVSRDQAAAGAGVARHTAKFHLDKLVEEGLLTTEFRRLTGRDGPGAGRPAKLYRRVAGEVAVSLPARRYDLAGRLMAAAIDEAATDGTPVAEALDRQAAAYGTSLGDEARGTSPGDETRAQRLCGVLADHGYEPYVVKELEVDEAGAGDVGDGAGTVLLRNCPFHALAREHTALVCGMNLALITAAADRADAGMEALLAPAEGRCCVVLDQRAERPA